MDGSPTTALLPKRGGPTPGPTLFLLQGLSEIGGILELQAPEAQRETPTSLGLNIHNDKEFSP